MNFVVKFWPSSSLKQQLYIYLKYFGH
jgi:hypothetical protein